jgi:neural Wiskott-Aldrich syndrome protein
MAPVPGAGRRRRAAQTHEPGQLVENIPRTMKVAVPTVVEVRIAKADVTALAEGLQGGGSPVRHDIRVTKAMAVRLRAPEGGFWIDSGSPETQWIDGSPMGFVDEYASWRWTVTPQERGKKRLQLIVSARTVGADGLAAETALPDQIIDVKVKTNYAKTMKQVGGWTIAAILGGIFAKFGEGIFGGGVRAIARTLGL